MIFKCKMCGGSLEIKDDATVIECEFCGTKQTLPRLDSEKKANLYDRANHFRRNNEYDKAMSIYEQILAEDTLDAESYWSIVLCKYGIEYVEDATTKRRIPTINRMQSTSIFADEDYRSAIANADSVQKEIYQAEAREIDKIQKGILEVSSKEEPYDVFICYKETEVDGKRTRESVYANDIYHELTEEGLKVFFARITLEDKLGTAYEPYIFSALNSSKVMIVIGTKPENINAVWVKNEWSRYLSLIKNGAKKTLIPCYKDMDPYDLPEEFSHLQAQDMEKIGFIQDLIRGVKKICKPQKEEKVVSNVNISNGASIEALLERAKIALEDGEFDEVDGFCEKVLDLDAKNSTAYLYKLMASLSVNSYQDLPNLQNPFDDNPILSKIDRYDEELSQKLFEINEGIKERNQNALMEEAYSKAKQVIEIAITEQDVQKAINGLELLAEKNYKDSKEIIIKGKEKIKEINKQEEARRLQSLYEQAVSLSNSGFTSAVQESIRIFHSISGYLDTDERVRKAEERLKSLQAKEEEDRRLNEERVKQAERAKKKKKRITLTIILCIALAIITTIIVVVSLKKADLKARGYCLLELNGSEYTVVGLEEDAPNTIVIPESYKGLPVTGIGDSAFYNCKSLTVVTIGNSVKEIGDRAFYNCSSLTEVTIGDSVKEIGSYAFIWCKSLTSVTIGDSVKEIGNYAFDNCKTLTKVNYTGDIDSWCEIEFSYYSNPLIYAKNLYINDTLVKEVNITKATKINAYAFYYYSSLTKVTIGDSVKEIGWGAFYNCSSLTVATIGNSVTSIRSYAFYDCSKLTSITIGSGVKEIGDYAFSSCSSLTSITIPEATTSIGSYAFDYCKSLTSITIGGSVESIGKYAFRICSSLTSVTILGGSIGEHAFEDCSSLTSITIGKNVKEIGYSAFEDCSSLTKVNYTGDIDSWCEIEFKNDLSNPLIYAKNLYINDTLVTEANITKATKINAYAFYKCSSLTSITIPDSVNEIGSSAFYSCSSLTKVTIGDNVTSIGNYAFEYCSSLTVVTIPEATTSIGDYAFSGCSSLTSITFSDSSNWYRTSNSTNWKNKTGGMLTTLSNPSTNATYLKSTYLNSYWYKLDNK